MNKPEHVRSVLVDFGLVFPAAMAEHVVDVAEGTPVGRRAKVSSRERSRVYRLRRTALHRLEDELRRLPDEETRRVVLDRLEEVLGTDFVSSTLYGDLLYLPYVFDNDALQRLRLHTGEPLSEHMLWFCGLLGIQSTKDFGTRSLIDFLRLPNFGKKRAAMLTDALAHHGIALRPEP